MFHDRVPQRAQVGINDTLLTRALEMGDFRTAEKLIIENTDPSNLDDGPFDKIPLAFVLSGDAEFRTYPRHLRLAKLLVEGGANPNLRIPQSDWDGASASPMEYLVDLYNSARDLSTATKDSQSDSEMETSPLHTIGLNDETELPLTVLMEQLLDLLEVFLACGGNPNVTTTTSNSTLYHMVLSDPDPDMSLVMKLCEAGGDLNQTNVHGTTPLMDLVAYADGDLAMDILSSIWEKRPDISSLETQNCSNETTLWRCMLAGSPRVAIELIRRGADPVPRAMLSIEKWYWSIHKSVRDTVKYGVSALFAPLLQNSYPYVHYTTVYTSFKDDMIDDIPLKLDICLLNKVMACTVYPVVDATYFSECFPEAVLSELERLLTDETKFTIQELVPHPMRIQDTAVLMFGNLKSGLQQLCVRRIMHQVFFEKVSGEGLKIVRKLKTGFSNITTEEEHEADEKEHEADEKEHEADEKEHEADEKEHEVDEKEHEADEKEHEADENEHDSWYSESQEKETQTNFGGDQWDLVQEFTAPVIRQLVTQHLKLPSVLVARFQIEAARLQLGASLYTLESSDCIQGCDGESDASTDNGLDEDDDDDDDDDGSSWFSGCSGDDFDDPYLTDDWVKGFGDEEEMELTTTSDSSDDETDEHAIKQNPPTTKSSDESEKNSALSESCNSTSAESVPPNIYRDEYEPFSNEIFCDEDVSPTSAMDTTDTGKTDTT